MRSKAWICGPSLAGIAGSNPARDMDISHECLCCQVEVSESSWSHVQRNPTECGVSECDREALIMRRLWPTRALLRHEGIITYPVFLSSVNI